jgi:hypothetical protein
MAAAGTRWTCPDCGREFGAVGRGHICQPGLTMEEFLDSALPVARPVVETIVAHLRAVDHDDLLIVDPVDSAVLLKAGPTFALLRPMKRWVAVGFSLRRKLESSRLSRKVADHGSRYHHVVNIDDAAGVDDELLAWLVEAFLGEVPAPVAAAGAAGDGPAGPGDPMVPDDIDDELL